MRASWGQETAAREVPGGLYHLPPPGQCDGPRQHPASSLAAWQFGVHLHVYPLRATCLHLSCIVHTDVVQVVLCIITGKLLKTRHNRFHASLAKFTPLEHWFIFQTMEHINTEISGNLSILRRSIFRGVYKTLKVFLGSGALLGERPGYWEGLHSERWWCQQSTLSYESEDPDFRDIFWQ